MRFLLVDKILDMEPGKSITTLKALTVSEEYLADHFPGFAVMPGVLMLEALTESAAWLIRVTDDFADTVIVLKEARNVRYNHFVQPGECLTMKIEILDRSQPGLTKVKAEGYLGDRLALSGKLVLHHHKVADIFPKMAWKDTQMVEKQRRIYSLLLR